MHWTEEEYEEFKRRQGQPSKFVSGLKASADRTVLAVQVDILLTLSFPPSSNRYWRNYNGKTVKSEEAQKYQDDVKKVCVGIKPLDGEVAVTMRFYRPRKSGDLDNRIKICLDALQGIAFHDDKQVGEIFARRYDDKKNPRVEIFVRPLEK